MSKKTTKRGNINAEFIYDPFPKSGLVKRYEPFIRKHVREFCDRYPGLQYETVLCWAVEQAMAAEKNFKPSLGNDFSTFLRPYLKRLHRLAERDLQFVPRVYETTAEKQRREAEEIGEQPQKPNFAGGGNGARITFDFQSGRRRLVLGIQLNSSDHIHARGIAERASPDLKIVLDVPADEAVMRGRWRAVLDHQERRQREADQEAENQRLGCHAPVFLEAKDIGAEVKTYRARKPPRHYPEHLPMARLDDAYGHSDDWKGVLHDTIVAGQPVSDAQQQERLVREAVAAERPFLSKNELRFLDWIEGQLLGTDRRLLVQVARDCGITKGAASKIKNRLIKKLQARLQK